MNNQIIETQKRLEEQIDMLNISYDQKERMKKALQGIILSPNGRLYFEKNTVFQRYLTLRKENLEPFGNYNFCIVSTVLDEYSALNKETNYDFPSLSLLAEIMENHKDIIDSEIVNAENHQRIQKKEQQIRTQQPVSQQSPSELFKENMKSCIDALDNIPGYKKQRVLDVLDAISSSITGKIYSVRNHNYSEAIGLRKDNNGLGYFIITKIVDEYSGSTLSSSYEPIAARGLIEYVESNRITIDKELKKIKEKNQHSIKKVSDEDGWDR